VKNLLAIAVTCTLMMFVAGCEGANSGMMMPSLPESVQGAAGAGAQATAQPAQITSESNGGSSLAAASPYAGDGKGGAVQQNVNPTPFLQASSPMKAGMELPAGALVSRADGTMYGPKDMSPAGAGPGIEGPGTGGSTPNQSFRGAGTKSTAGATIPGNQSNKGAIPK
jgi:hypothetical protein